MERPTGADDDQGESGGECGLDGAGGGEGGVDEDDGAFEGGAVDDGGVDLALADGEALGPEVGLDAYDQAPEVMVEERVVEPFVDEDGDEGGGAGCRAGELDKGSGASAADEEPLGDELVEGSGEGDAADSEGAGEVGFGGEAGSFGDGAGSDEAVEVEADGLVCRNPAVLSSETLRQHVVRGVGRHLCLAKVKKSWVDYT